MSTVPPLDAIALYVAALRAGSISAGARELGLSQQAASAKLRLLERTVGCELIVRSPRGIAATATGEVVASWAEGVLVAARVFSDGVAALRGDQVASLKVAASQTVAAYYLPEWLLHWRSAQLAAGLTPTAVHLVTDNSHGVEELVRDGSVDLGFTESRAFSADLDHAVVTFDELVLVVPKGHPWEQAENLGFAEVADTGLVSREQGSGTRSTWEDEVKRVLGREAAVPSLVLSTSKAIKSAVASGVGPAVLSRAAVADDVALGRLSRIRTSWPHITRPLAAIWRKGPRGLHRPACDLLESIATTHP